MIAALDDAGLPPLAGHQYLSTQFDFVPVAMIVAALVLYLWAVRRNNALHPRHRWSGGKTAAWLGALFTTAVAIFSFVGVSNYSEKETRAMDAALRRRGLRLASNQVEFSLLRTMPLRVGLVGACRELGVLVLAYSPIGQGRLTGKYSAAHPPPGKRSFSAHPWEEVDAVVAALRRIGAAHGDRTPSQVALAYLIAKGTVPIPGAKNREQAEQNAGALGWQMSNEEVAALDEVSLYGKRGIAQRVWQHG